MKNIYLLFFLFLLTGCSNINHDLSVAIEKKDIESVKRITENNEIDPDFNYNGKKVTVLARNSKNKDIIRFVNYATNKTLFKPYEGKWLVVGDNIRRYFIFKNDPERKIFKVRMFFEKWEGSQQDRAEMEAWRLLSFNEEDNSIKPVSFFMGLLYNRFKTEGSALYVYETDMVRRGFGNKYHTKKYLLKKTD